MMNELIESVSRLTEEEYQRAAAKFGPKNNSPHESYAVLLEEFEEADSEVSTLDHLLDEFWDSVKRNSFRDCARQLKEVKKYAILGACELIQVAAMADKALAGYEQKEEQ